MTNPISIAELVHRKERVYYAIMVVISLVVYATLVAVIVATPASGAVILGYGIGIPLVLFFIHGMVLGQIRGNAVRITARQFPEMHALAMQHAKTLGISTLPEIFLVESGGVLNAFATRFLGRDFVIIHSDVMAMAESQGGDAVSFILAHELGHVKRGHLKNRWLITPGRMVPYLGSAWSRACEYTCDRIGAHCEPNGAIRGLVALAAGPKLYKRVDVREYMKQVETEKGFWVGRAELLSTHPRLPKRVAALVAAGVPTPGVSAPAISPVGELGAHAPGASYSA